MLKQYALAASHSLVYYGVIYKASEAEEQMPSDEIHESISRLLLDHSQVAYHDEAETWRDLERKAQGTAAIAGVFVAAVFLLLRQYEHLTPVEGALLAAVLLALPVAVWLCVRAMRVSEIEVPEAISEVRHAALQVVAATTDAEAQQEIRAFVHARAEGWQRARESLFQENQRKAKAVARAQNLVLLSVIVVALIGLLRACAVLSVA